MATVLVVDDHPINRDLVRTLLSYRGHRVFEARDGLEALEIAGTDRPDLVITDVLMPGMDGCELVRALRREPDLAAIPVVFYTANYLEDEIKPIAEAYGVSSVLPKSSDPDVLLRTVEAALTGTPRRAAPLPDERAMDRHLQTVNAKLVEKVRELEDKEAELRASEERFRRMAESAPLGLFLGDARGRAVYVNPRLVELLDCPAHELLGDGWREHLGLAPQPAGQQSDAAATGQTRNWRHPARLGGSDRWFNIGMSTVRGAGGEPFATIGTVDDVTSIVEAEQRQRELDARLQVTQRLEGLGRLAGGVAHDFNNMLTVIMAYARFARADSLRGMEHGQVQDETGRLLLAHLDSVLSAGDQAANLTGQLLTFGRRDTARPSVLDLNTALRDVSELLDRTLGEHIEIIRDLTPNLWPVLADSSQLGQIVLNLAVNARDAMRTGGTLTLRTTNCVSSHGGAQLPADLPAGRYVRLTVDDTGCGMTPEVAARALDPFFTTKSPGEGTGLGLATVYGIVSRAGGRLAIRSVVDQGTTVDIFLPAAGQATAAASPAAADERAAPGGTETVLVVDDEPALGAIAERILTGAGYEVILATSGPEAIDTVTAGQRRVDLLLTDVVMPRMLGDELARRLNTVRPAAKVLYMSGWADALTDDKGTLPPGTTLLSKPFSGAALLCAVRGILDAAASEAGKS